MGQYRITCTLENNLDWAVWGVNGDDQKYRVLDQDWSGPHNNIVHIACSRSVWSVRHWFVLWVLDDQFFNVFLLFTNRCAVGPKCPSSMIIHLLELKSFISISCCAGLNNCQRNNQHPENKNAVHPSQSNPHRQQWIGSWHIPDLNQ